MNVSVKCPCGHEFDTMVSVKNQAIACPGCRKGVNVLRDQTIAAMSTMPFCDDHILRMALVRNVATIKETT